MTTGELAARGLRVKPLVWDDCSWNTRGELDGVEAQNACVEIYLAMSTRNSFWVLSIDGRKSWHGSTEAAKAAAEAHHAARIAAMIDGYGNE